MLLYECLYIFNPHDNPSVSNIYFTAKETEVPILNGQPKISPLVGTLPRISVQISLAKKAFALFTMSFFFFSAVISVMEAALPFAQLQGVLFTLHFVGLAFPGEQSSDMNRILWSFVKQWPWGREAKSTKNNHLCPT